MFSLHYRNAAKFLIVSLLLSFSNHPTSSASMTPKPGAKCPLKGFEQENRGVRFTCVKSSGKLVWKKMGKASKIEPGVPTYEMRFKNLTIKYPSSRRIPNFSCNSLDIEVVSNSIGGELIIFMPDRNQTTSRRLLDGIPLSALELVTITSLQQTIPVRFCSSEEERLNRTIYGVSPGAYELVITDWGFNPNQPGTTYAVGNVNFSK
jgi:hypothetical protein